MASSSWIFFAFLLLISSDQVLVRCNPDLEGFLKQTESMVGALQGKFSPCMQKILPCQPFLKAPENPPPACCTPLKEMVEGDAVCRCSIFGNAEVLKTLNVSQTQALMLPKACALEVDISTCETTATSPTGSTDAPTSPPDTTAATSSDSAPPSSTPSSSTSRKNPSYGIGYGFVAAVSILTYLLHFNPIYLYL